MLHAEAPASGDHRVHAGDPARLAAAQAALVRALTGREHPPEGFDTAGIDAATRTLLWKRARGLTRACPELECMLGTRFPSLFSEFAARTPLPARGGSSADLYAFLCWLTRAGLATDELRLELMRARLRRGWPFVVGWQRESRRLVVATALPGIRPYWLSLPLGARLSRRAPPCRSDDGAHS